MLTDLSCLLLLSDGSGGVQEDDPGGGEDGGGSAAESDSLLYDVASKNLAPPSPSTAATDGPAGSRDQLRGPVTVLTASMLVLSSVDSS